MKTLPVACLLLLLVLGCASTSPMRVDDEVYSESYTCPDYPYNCLDDPYFWLNAPYPWYGIYPYDWWDYDVYDYDYWYYPAHDRHYPYYLWRHHHPQPTRPGLVWKKPHQVGERIATIRKYRREAREERMSRVRQARQHRIEVRRERASSFRSSFHRSGPAHGFRGGMGGFRRR